MLHDDERAAAEWSITRTYSGEGCSLEVAIVLARDYAHGAEEDSDLLDYVRLRLIGGQPGCTNEVSMAVDVLKALRNMLASEKGRDLVEWATAVCESDLSQKNFATAAELLFEASFAPTPLADSDTDERITIVLDDSDYAKASNEDLLSLALDNWDDDSVLAKVVSEFMSGRELSTWITVQQEVQKVQRRLVELVRREGRLQSNSGSEETTISGTSLEWPSEAMESRETAFSQDFYSYKQGVLSFMGYHVGEQSTLSPQARRRILDYVLGGRLPNVNDPEYMKDWGAPRSSKRLFKMAHSLASFSRSARANRVANKSVAVAEWDADLAYLKSMYYRPGQSHHWHWPKST